MNFQWNEANFDETELLVECFTEIHFEFRNYVFATHLFTSIQSFSKKKNTTNSMLCYNIFFAINFIIIKNRNVNGANFCDLNGEKAAGLEKSHRNWAQVEAF